MPWQTNGGVQVFEYRFWENLEAHLRRALRHVETLESVSDASEVDVELLESLSVLAELFNSECTRVLKG